ncbi:7 transmembrane receptor (rhodopsin family) domain-containing protein [Ditylenchus destructor]|uniref:7 transmembrane receptor (Rhodopsin family) domain-containing protein n=1 Tax=Ditylenchus destructor TaxID=166010 RepID=A0AAD4MWB9_9BILA|nr:7 transmembrane receptor (rhodopsin family) domain-containing protein [Ditylenchus destructor]
MEQRHVSFAGLPEESTILFLRGAGVLIATVTLTGLVANAFVVVAVLGSRRMRCAAINLLLANLAITDFLYLLSRTAIWIPFVITARHEWVGPKFLCPIERYLSQSFIMMSILTYFAIAIERYLAIVHPLHIHQQLCKRCRITITFIWAFTLTCQLPIYLMFQGIVNFGDYEFDERMCGNPHFPPLYLVSWIWLWTIFSIIYIIPTVVSTVLYFKICRVLWASNGLRTNSLPAPIKSSSTGHQSLTNLDGRRNVVKMLIICVLVFYISYTPLAVFYMWGAIFNVRMDVPLEFEFAALLLVMFSSALNPFLYTLFSRTFRDRLFCICRRVLSRKSTTESTLVNGSL